MDTRNKTNAEFREEVHEALSRHESNFEQINVGLQLVLTEIQSLKVSRIHPITLTEVIPLHWERLPTPLTLRGPTLPSATPTISSYTFQNLMGRSQVVGSTGLNNILSFKTSVLNNVCNWPPFI